MTTKPPNHLDTLRKMLREERGSPFLVDGGPGHKRIAALRAAIAALEAPAVPPPVIQEIVVRMGPQATATKHTYQLHENGRATRVVDSEREFKSEVSLSWKTRDDGATLEIAFP